MSGDALVLTHNSAKYDYWELEEEFLEALDSFEGDKYTVVGKDGDVFGSVDAVNLPYGGAENYDEVLMDRHVSSGFVNPEDARSLVESYSTLYLGGGFVDDCQKNTQNQLKEAADRLEEEVEFVVVPELSFYTAGEDVITLDQVRQRHQGLFEKKLSPFDGDVKVKNLLE